MSVLNTISVEQKAQYKNEGFFVLDNAVPPQLLEQMRTK